MSSTSRDTAVMKGSTMKARTTPAVKIDRPPPWNSGPGCQPGMLAQRRRQDPGHEVILYERDDDEDAHHAEHDARDRGEHLDARAQHARQPGVDELDEQQRDQERQRNGEHHGDQR